MSVSVVIPTTRPSVRSLIWSLNQGFVKPDEILVVSNEELAFDEPGPGDIPVYRVRFRSTEQPYGKGDAGLRRNIGATLAKGEIILFQDDDQIAPRNLLQTTLEVVARDGFCWGNHRRIDFDRFSPGDLLDLDPAIGLSRENGVNRWHGWQSSYAGNLAMRRDLFWDLGGFDLAYLGHHGNEDQQLGRRLSLRGKNPGHTWVHEPPFAWHPLADRYHSTLVTNITGTHSMVTTTINRHRFLVCGECPCRTPVDTAGLTMSETTVIQFSREQFTLKKERI